MRLKRKVAALVTTAAMVLSLFGGVASAGTFSDVPADKSYAGAVERLAGLGVVNGVGDGKYDPEGQYTRAQFAALAVRLRGIKTAGSGATDFSDVPATHWASGWINLATGLGIIKGMGDGTFHPDDPVTHAQALTMLLRTMGYEPAIKKGPWPSVVLAKAAELELDKGVNVVPNLPATRGEVAMFADNALTQPLMVLDQVTEDGKEIYKKAVDANGNVTASIAKTYLKSTTVEGILVDSPENLANADKKYVKVDTNGDGVANDSIELVSGTKYAGLLGHKVKVWKNTDGKAYFVEDETSADKVLTVKAGDIVTSGGNITKVKVGTSEYTLADLNTSSGSGANDVVYIKDRAYNGAPATIAGADLDASDDVDNGKFIAILNDDGKVQAVVATKSNHAIVDSVSAANEAITATGDWAGPGSLKDKTVTWSGAASKVGDLQKGDVLEWLAANEKVVINVTRNNKTGTLDRIGDKQVRVGGTDYSLASHTFKAGWDDNSNLGKSVTLYLDQFGKFIKLEVGTGTGGATGNPVAVIKAGNLSGPEFSVYTQKLRVLKSDGTTIDLTVAKDATVYNDRNDSNPTTFDQTVGTDNSPADGIQDDLNAKGVKKGNGIEYVLNADGKIEKIIVLADVSGVAWDAENVTVSKDPARVNTGTDGNGGDGTQPNTTYGLTTNTVAFNVYDSNTDNWTVMKGTDLTVDTAFSGKVVRDKDNTALARFVVVNGSFSATGTNLDHYGLIMSRYTVAGPKTMYSVNEKGTISEIEALNTAGDVDGNQVGDQVYGADQVLKFRVVGGKFDGAYTSLANEHSAMSAGYKVWQVDATNNVIKVSNDNGATIRTYLLFTTGDTPTQYFNLKGDAAAVSISLSDVAVGDKVSIWTDPTDTSVARVVTVDK